MNPNERRNRPPCGHLYCPDTQCRFDTEESVNAYANAMIKRDQLLGYPAQDERRETGADARLCSPRNEWKYRR